MSNQYPYNVLSGNIVRFTLMFTDFNNDPSDPSTVSAIVGIPGQPAMILVVDRDGTGLYHADWDTTAVASGLWYCVANGTGAIVAASEIPVRILASQVAS